MMTRQERAPHWVGLALVLGGCAGGDDTNRWAPDAGFDDDAAIDLAEATSARGVRTRQATDAGATTDASSDDAREPALECAPVDALLELEPSTAPEHGADVPDCLAGFPIDAARLRLLLAELSGASGARIDDRCARIAERASAAGREVARTYLSERYELLGYAVSRHAYASGENLIAERAGEDDSVFIVSAHLDAVPESPGADDDASGIITALLAAAALRDCELQHTLRFVAFDEEEEGLIGSAAYAADLPAHEAENMLGLLQLEMTGYDGDGDGRYLIVDCARQDSAFIADAVTRAVQLLDLPLLDVRGCAYGSDHDPFWSLGIPAVVVGELFFPASGHEADPNPCYHRECDDLEQLDFDYMAALASAVTLAVAELTGAQ